MRELTDEQVIELMRHASPAGRDGPAADLWPRVRRTIDQPTPTLGRSDWVLAVALVILCLLRPGWAGVLLLHF